MLKYKNNTFQSLEMKAMEVLLSFTAIKKVVNMQILKKELRYLLPLLKQIKMYIKRDHCIDDLTEIVFYLKIFHLF